jgi:hypothetical protein
VFVEAVTSGQELARTTSKVSLPTEKGQENWTGSTSDKIAEPSGDDSKKVKSGSSAEIGDRLRTLEEKLDELQMTIATQQQTIKALSDKLAKNDVDAFAAQSEVSKAAVVTAEQTQTPPPIEDRVKKLESDALRIGPLKLSGDFRLRFDGIFRSADPNPPPGLPEVTHQQNARMRYRFRLNLDTELDSKLSFHGQLATGPINNPLTNDQDFGETTTRHPFFVNEAWIDYHPSKALQLQAGRVQEVLADTSRFLFDDDIRFNGFNEKYTWSLKKTFADITSIEARAGQYFFSNPNVAIVTSGSPLAQADAVVGSTGRASNLFHQGLLFNQKYNEKWNGQFGGDVQLYRNPNQIQLASTANGVGLIVQNGLGLALSGPIAGTGNATTTNGGAIYTARNFQIARFTYRLNWAGFKQGDHVFPVAFNVQGSRNVGVGINERDAMLTALQVGRITKRGDTSYLYIFAIKGANSLISQLTDDDIGTNSGVNIRTHVFRFELGLAKKVTWQSLLFIQNELRNSGQFPNFFVPLNGFTPRQYRLQEQLVFTF